MNNGLDAFKKKAPGKFAKFLQPGATTAGIITEISDQKQAKKFNRDPKAARELDFWPSGDPVMEVWISLQTQERDPQDPEDTGIRVVVVTVNQKAGGQLAAIMDACEAAGAETPLPGGLLAITFTGFDPNSENAQNPRKLYAARYQLPAPGGGAFQQPQAQPAQQAPAQQYNEFNPAPAAQVAPPVQQFQQPPVQQAAPAQQGGAWDAVQVQALIAQGMDDNTISATTGAPLPAIAAIRGIG
ncbi:hypothetical protein [Paenarthrobacter ilicis]|uniref:hypothetical protein n=1 Tax=Paenarthrobacter ilicis TaxID=43665 RepID=UPI0028D10FA0|nr:hypothetical protein [Paenarthrobacter ilicis]